MIENDISFPIEDILGWLLLIITSLFDFIIDISAGLLNMGGVFFNTFSAFGSPIIIIVGLVGFTTAYILAKYY